MKRTVLVGMLALASVSAQAAHDVPGWRIGAAASFSQFEFDDDAGDSKDSAVGAKVSVQYQFNSLFGIEGAYHNTGEFSEDIVTATDALPAGQYDLRFDGFSVSGVGYFPTSSEELRFYGKVGFFDFDDELALDGFVTSRGSESGLTAGAGAMIEISERFGLRADLDWFDAEVGDLWSANLGIEYFFGGSKAGATAASSEPPPPPAMEEPPVAEVAAAETAAVAAVPADSDGDGVNDGADQCADTPAGAAVDARGCEQKSVVLEGVNFESNSDQLTSESTGALDTAAEAIKARAGGYNVEVRGHTDSAGPDEYNLDLSQRRANTVMDYLIGQGVEASRITATGYGETQPVADNETAEGRAQNRRVALEFTEAN